MTKINNFHKMQMIMRVLTAMIIVVFLALVCTPWHITAKMTLVIAEIILIRILLKAKCIEYEFSGECITIKRFHPFYQKKRILPFAEFPRQYLKDFSFEESQIISKLIIVLNTGKRKDYTMKLQMAGFNDQQVKDLAKSLESIKKTNTNEY
jgi:hypothetical protein